MFLSPINLILVAIILFVLYVVKTKWKFFVFWWKVGGPNPIPYVVPTFTTQLKDILYSTEKWCDLSGKDWYGFCWMGSFPLFYVADPDIIHNVLISQDCLKKPLFYDTVTHSFGYGLLAQDNPEWSKSRKLINPVFTRKNLLSFIPIFNNQTDVLIEILDKYVESGPVDLFTFIAKCNFDITSETIMGTQLNAQKIQDCVQWEAIVSLAAIALQRCTQFWLLYKPIFSLSNLYKTFIKDKSTLHNWVQEVIQNKLTKVNLNEMNNPKMNDMNCDNCIDRKPKSIFIDYAYNLVKRNEFSWNDFESQSKNLIAASFETTATTIHNVIMVLAMYPDIQERVFEEIYSLFPNKNFEISYEETLEMTYLDKIVNETLRLFPTVPAIGRETIQDVEIKKGIYIPKGTIIAMDIFNLHRNSNYWGENCNKFDPENFSSENMNGRHPYAFIPFLKGLRNCIGIKYAGISLKIILSKMIRNYRFTTDFKFEDLHCVTAISIKFVDTPKINIYRREY